MATSGMSPSEKPMTGDQRNMEEVPTNGDYTVNQPNVDNGSPVYIPNNYVTNAETNMQWQITTQPTTPFYDRNANNVPYNYGYFESTTQLPPPNYAWNPPYPSFPPYGTDDRVQDIPNQETYFYGPDEKPAIFNGYGNCDCGSKDGNLDGSDVDDFNADDVNAIGVLNSDMYEIILTTIAFMAFGTYFVNMIMKVTEVTNRCRYLGNWSKMIIQYPKIKICSYLERGSGFLFTKFIDIIFRKIL